MMQHNNCVLLGKAFDSFLTMAVSLNGYNSDISRLDQEFHNWTLQREMFQQDFWNEMRDSTQLADNTVFSTPRNQRQH